MKKYANPYLHTNHEIHPGFLILHLIMILGLQACEISTSVPFELPDYEPEIIIHAVASPQSGGSTLIKYSQPVSGYAGEAPDLPDFEVWLLQNGILEIRFHQDSIDMVQDNSYTVQTIFLSIPADSL